MTTLNQLNPWYISGLTQADGSFFCVVSNKANALFGLQFRPKFTLTQDLGSLGVLVSIQRFFGCGKIHTNPGTNSAEFVVDNKLDLINIIIPHFVAYPVVLDKLHSFNLFTEVVKALVNNTHRTVSCRASLLNMVLSMNAASQRSASVIDALYAKLGINNGSGIPLIPNTMTSIATAIHNAFIAGFIDGDGSFSIIFNSDGTIKPFVSVIGSQSIIPLLECIMTVFSGAGTISLMKDGAVARWQVTGTKQVQNFVIPFMDNELLHTEKSRHYEIFREACSILASSNVSLADRLRVVELAYDMNKSGKRRNMTKQEYINLLISSKTPLMADWSVGCV